MGPTWGPPWSCRPQTGPVLAHEPCYQGAEILSLVILRPNTIPGITTHYNLVMTVGCSHVYFILRHYLLFADFNENTRNLKIFGKVTLSGACLHTWTRSSFPSGSVYTISTITSEQRISKLFVVSTWKYLFQGYNSIDTSGVSTNAQ